VRRWEERYREVTLRYRERSIIVRGEREARVGGPGRRKEGNLQGGMMLRWEEEGQSILGMIQVLRS
jgi:hypothetical protein